MAVTLRRILLALEDMTIKSFINSDPEKTEIKKYQTNGPHTEACSADTIILIRLSKINKALLNGPSPLIIIADSDFSDQQFTNADADLILLDPACDQTAITLAIEAEFAAHQRLGDCSIRLLQACQQGATIQQLLDLGYQMLNNPLLLVDVSLCFIAHSGGNLIENEPLWEWTLSKGYVNKEYAQSVMRDPSQEEMADGKEVLVIWETGLLNHRQLVGRVLKNGRPLAYLKLLEYNRPISPNDEDLLIMICNVLALNLTAASTTENSLTDTFLIALLNQKMYDHAAIEEREKIYGLKLYKNLFAVVIRIDNRQNTNDRLYYLKRIVQNFFNRQTVIIYNGQLVLLLDSRTREIQELAAFDNLLQENDCTAGVSMVFYHLYDFCEHYTQASNALSLGDQLTGSSRIRTYDDLIVPHMILSFSGQTNIRNLIHPIVETLKTVDKQKGSQLLNSLMAYIRHNQDTTLTAKFLHIHYNTLKYRISRIVEITGLDFNDSETLFRIQLAVKVNELIDGDQE
ncbi:helix-turn-helix domain-containing protein [Eubacteriaceae bacterium ES2]|nr:helix-turn-helix domain-containing protein [Eubacteriaceae bacterium ES2]